MKIISIVSTLDFQYRMGTTPLMWQLMKALHEVGHTVICSTYLGKAIESPYWKVYPNPLEVESDLYNSYLDMTSTRSVGQKGLFSKLSTMAIKNIVNPIWRKHLIKMCELEKPDCVLFVLVPLNHIKGIATEIRQRFSIPVLFFDPDLPSSFNDAAKGLDSFKFAMYKGADISEYDCYLSNSKGICAELLGFGAKRVETVYYAVDTSIFSPLKGIEQDVDVFYYGHRNIGKENQFDYMMAEASKMMPEKIFVVGGTGHNYDIGNCIPIGRLSLPEWRYWCARSKINLNITKDTDSIIYASSSARPFELAGMGCCIVSDPYDGSEEWFTQDEMFTHKSMDMQMIYNIYSAWTHGEHYRTERSKKALQRVFNCHTYQHRARQITEIIRSL